MQQLCLIHDKKAVNLPVSEHLPGKFPSTVAVRLPVHTVSCRLPVTSPHGNFATVTSPQKLRRMVTSPHFEKVKGDVWG